jgi:hypothetical protein
MFSPADPDRPVKAFLQEYQALFGFGTEVLDSEPPPSQTNATARLARIFHR